MIAMVLCCERCSALFTEDGVYSHRLRANFCSTRCYDDTWAETFRSEKDVKLAPPVDLESPGYDLLEEELSPVVIHRRALEAMLREKEES